MRKPHLLFAMAAAMTATAVTEIAAQAPSGPAPYLPGIADLMNANVQPRHLKLGLAGQTGNWPLAEYELKMLTVALANVARAHPKFKGMPLADITTAATDEPARDLRAAIRAHDNQQFAAAYGRLTDGCNACHSSLDHPFVVIKTPDQSAFPNQDFVPAR
jgi:hypothetical protein